MTISLLRWPVLFVLVSSAGVGACSSEKAASDGGVPTPDAGGLDAQNPGDTGTPEASDGQSSSSLDGGSDAGDATTGGDGAGSSATMFLNDDLSSAVYRYAIAPNADPVLTATIPISHAKGMAIRSTGELFVTEWASSGTIFRFTTPLGTPMASGTITGVGADYAINARFIDDELWLLNSTGACSTNPRSIVRLAFDAQGAGSVAGTVANGLIGANRGMLWVAARRDLYVSQCTPIDTIQHYHVATDHTVTTLTPLTGNALFNPHGMVMTPWGELIVANGGLPGSGNYSLLRFTVDAQGAATANGSIIGNGLNIPIGLEFAPWGELFVVNNGNATLSRFTFDASRAAVPNGTFQLAGPTNAGNIGVGWIVLAP